MKRMFVVLFCSMVLTGFGLSTVQAGPVIAKDHTQYLVKTNKNLVNVLRKNVNFCNKAVVKVKAFHKKNIAEFKRKKAATKKFMERLSPAQRKAAGQRIAKQVMQMYGEMLKVSGQFQKKCPKHGKKMTKVFEDFSLK